MLATAVAAGVLYLDGQRPRDIAVVAGALLALLATLVLIAPRLHVPEEEDVPRTRYDEPAADDTTRRHGSVPPERQAGPGAPAAPAATTGSEPASTESGNSMPARSAPPGRRAKRGRRRR